MREVVATVAPTPIPGVPGLIRGAVNLAGRVVVVVDLARLIAPGHDEDVSARLLCQPHFLRDFPNDRALGFLAGLADRAVVTAARMGKDRS